MNQNSDSSSNIVSLISTYVSSDYERNSNFKKNLSSRSIVSNTDSIEGSFFDDRVVLRVNIVSHRRVLKKLIKF